MQNNELLDYVRELRDVFGDVEAAKVLLLKVATLIYPLLKGMGIRIFQPIVIVAESDIHLNRIYNELAGFSKEIPLPLNLSNKEIQRRFEDNEYETFRTKYIGGKKSEESIACLNVLCQLEHAERCLILMGVCGGIESCNLELTAGVIYMQESFEGQITRESKQAEFTKELLQFVEANQSIIFYQIREKLIYDWQSEFGEKNVIGKLFYCAESVIELLVEEAVAKLDERAEVMHFVKAAMEDIFNNLDYMNMQDTIWKNQFVEMLHKSASKIPRILNRERIESSDLDDIGKLPMYDEKYYYVPESLLREICQTWLTYINFSRLRMLLAYEGIILTEGKSRKYYTLKTPVITVYGAVKYVRMMKIPRSEIDIFGELTWSEILLMEEKEDEGDN